VLVTLGGGIGGCLRYGLSGLIGRRFGEYFPWGTLVVNISGAFVIGAATALLARMALPSDYPRLFLVVGILGGYTTVSLFSLQTLGLALDGRMGRAALNVLGSAAGCMAAVGLGYALFGGAA